MAAKREDLFCPVLCVTTYKLLDDAVSMAKDTEVALASYVW